MRSAGVIVGSQISVRIWEITNRSASLYAIVVEKNPYMVQFFELIVSMRQSLKLFPRTSSKEPKNHSHILKTFFFYICIFFHFQKLFIFQNFAPVHYYADFSNLFTPFSKKIAFPNPPPRSLYFGRYPPPALIHFTSPPPKSPKSTEIIRTDL